MPPAKRTKLNMAEMSEDEDEGPTTAKKRMLQECLVVLAETQFSPPLRQVTGVVRIRREEDEDISDPPVSPFLAQVETVSLVVPDSQQSDGQPGSGSSIGSSGRRNFKKFVRKGRKENSLSQGSASQIRLVECKLQAYDRSEYQTFDDDRDLDFEDGNVPAIGRGTRTRR